MSRKPAPGTDADPLRDPAEPEPETHREGDEQDPSFMPQQVAQLDHKPSSV